MIEVSIDMSINDETSGNRIFGRVVDVQNNTFICEYTCANYDFDNEKKISDLEEKLRIATKTLEKYAEKENWQDCRTNEWYPEDSHTVELGLFAENGYTAAEQTLAKIKG